MKRSSGTCWGFERGSARLAVVVLGAACALAQKSNCVIQADAVGPIHAGMTVAQARQAMHGARLKPTEDAEQLPMLEVIRDGLHTMDLYVDRAPVTDQSKVGMIRVFDGECATHEGVHPGMHLSDAVRQYGRVKRMITTDPESREYAQFERAPAWLEVQVGNGREGIYPPGKRCTTNYVPSAHIASLWVSHAGAGKVPLDDSACNAPRR